jgi:hypothetical protein
VTRWPFGIFVLTHECESASLTTFDRFGCAARCFPARRKAPRWAASLVMLYREEHGHRPVTCDAQRDRLRDAGAEHVPDGGRVQVMEELSRAARFPARLRPSLAKVSEGVPFLVKGQRREVSHAVLVLPFPSLPTSLDP